MNDTAPSDEQLALIDLRAILDWLATPPAEKAEDELAPLHTHLAALRDTHTAAHQRHQILDLLYTRAHGVVQRLLPDLTGVSLPLSRRTRQTVRGMQDVLLMVAEDYLDTFGELDEHLIKGLRRPPELTLWRALDALASHLLVSDYSASPSTAGVWARLHRAYALALEAGVADTPAMASDETPRQVYVRSLLLACAQPASYTSREIGLVLDYIRRFSAHAELLTVAESRDDGGLFAVETRRDAPPTSASRRPPQPGMLCLNCNRLAHLAAEHVEALVAGAAPGELGLPEAAGTPAGQGVLRRLAHYWGSAGKRRFPRRRQNHRAVLCIGLPAVWELFHREEMEAGDLSSWIVTNESPDGYALMHVTGKTHRVVPGDVVAIRTEAGTDWQACIVRWALSDNPEHLEVGLQILAARATPAILACGAGDGHRLPVLVLPHVPGVRADDALLAPSGTARAGQTRMVLVVEGENHLAVREITATHVDEQTASIEVIAIRPAPGTEHFLPPNGGDDAHR